MSYASELASISRKPCSLIKMTLDYCAETFGSAPCTATGTKCFNTYTTCKDKANYNLTTQDYKFVSQDTAIPFVSGGIVRPYLITAKIMPTEIKDNQTVNARAKLSFSDENDTDVGIDPYLSTRGSVQGTFWKKLLARNKNYKGREIKVSEGFVGLAEGDFDEKIVGLIDNIKMKGKGIVEIEIKDLLTKLKDVEIAGKIECKLVADIDNSQTTITFNDASLVDDPTSETKYVKIEDEIISYTTRNTTTNQISGGARGQFGTTAVTHDENQKVELVRYYTADNPYDILLSMLQDDAGIDNAYINTTAFSDIKTAYGGDDIDRQGIIIEPTKLNVLYFELVDEMDCKSWVNEDLEITIEKNIQNSPGRSYTTITDQANIKEGSSSVDLNDKSRISRILLYWNKSTLGDEKESDSFSRLDIAVDVNAESVNEYNEQKEKVVQSRWLHEGLATEEVTDLYVANILARQLFRQRDAQMFLSLSVEMKDQDIKTGDFTKITTEDVQDKDGNGLTGDPFQVVKREKKGNLIVLKLIAMPDKRIAFIAPDGIADYSSASEAQREYAFVCNDLGEMANGDGGYHVY